MVLVSIGHTKQNINLYSLEKFLQYLQKQNFIKFRTINNIVQERKKKQTFKKNGDYYSEHIHQQIDCDRQAILGKERNWQQSFYAQKKIPLDRKKILDLGCGAGYWTKRLNDNITKTIGVDISEEFIQKAKENYPNLEFYKMDFHNLDFLDNSFDCIYADNVLEHSPYPQKILREVYRVLSNKGVFIALIPPDARNPQFSGSDHVWKTDKDEVSARLKEIGFQHINIEEIDVVKKFNMSSYRASNNIMLVITAWKQKERFSNKQRCKDIMDFVYNNLKPSRSQISEDPVKILKGGFAWCVGYAILTKYFFEKENYPTKWHTLFVKDHPRGYGRNKIETHEVIEARIKNNWILFDPTAGKCLEYNLKTILSNPGLIDEILKKHPKDIRWKEKRYDLYCSSWFYKKIFKIELETPFRILVKKAMDKIRKLCQKRIF